MKKKNKPDWALMRQGVNGLAEMYAELTAKCTRLEGEAEGLKREVKALVERQRVLTGRVDELGRQYASVGADEMMQEYFYGKRGGEDE